MLLIVSLTVTNCETFIKLKQPDTLVCHHHWSRAPEFKYLYLTCYPSLLVSDKLYNHPLHKQSGQATPNKTLLEWLLFTRVLSQVFTVLCMARWRGVTHDYIRSYYFNAQKQWRYEWKSFATFLLASLRAMEWVSVELRKMGIVKRFLFPWK